MDLENFPLNEAGKRMLDSISSRFYDNSYVGKWIFQVIGLEMGETRQLIEELPYQAFPETATWGLRYHEQKWHLPIRENLSYEERRKLIYQKRDYRAPMTPYHMERYLNGATGLDVHVCDIHDLGEFGFFFSNANQFKVVVIGEGNLDLRLVELLVNRLKQSHVAYEIVIESPMKSKIMVGTCYQEAHIIEMRQVV